MTNLFLTEKTSEKLPIIQKSTIIMLAYRIADSRIFLIKICLLMLWRKHFLIFQVFRLKQEQRKSIINLLRGEDAGYSDSSYAGYGKV
jgi:hypothetical protein